MFGANQGMSNKNKGWAFLESAIRNYDLIQDCEFVILGQSEPLNPPKLGAKIHYIGKLHDIQSISLLYSAVDLVVVPSLMENLPQLATEAQSCGTAVVGFNTSGMSDAVSHLKTGYLAEAFDPKSLNHGMNWCLESNERKKILSQNCRQRALNLWQEKIIAEKYIKLYKKIINLQKSD